ncbi:hypothetical protein QMK17_23470 [Rhodococcus sp. G-MC3]|uniref:hypothetical protein n=1 Tax=Rhodococcus sp. G-MC3 TaxID=3046209 RepID=UPI0024BA2BC5|nr:hypothetical protein [Rhodococcus sp. G-MC3]MDJ0396271.1 hypothetical protein [Rhodococcus sp. G-MC3]
MPAQAWVALIVGVLATIGVTATLRQRTSSENRTQAWLHLSAGHVSGVSLGRRSRLVVAGLEW